MIQLFLALAEWLSRLQGTEAVVARARPCDFATSPVMSLRPALPGASADRAKAAHGFRSDRKSEVQRMLPAPPSLGAHLEKRVAAEQNVLWCDGGRRVAWPAAHVVNGICEGRVPAGCEAVHARQHHFLHST